MKQNGLSDTANGTFTLENSLALFNILKMGTPYDNVILFLRMTVPTEMCLYISGVTWKMIL